MSNSTISPALSSTSTALLSSTSLWSTVTPKIRSSPSCQMWVPACFAAWDPGRKRRQPFVRRLSKTAIHTDVVASGLTGVWLASRCHGVAGTGGGRLVGEAGAPKEVVGGVKLLNDAQLDR